jgi:hypothetical protein
MLVDLVEQTMKEVAHRDDDVALLAKLDRLRGQVRQSVRRRPGSKRDSDSD